MNKLFKNTSPSKRCRGIPKSMEKGAEVAQPGRALG